MTEHFRLKGNHILLHPTTMQDMTNYERWNDPSLKAFKYNGPWYKNDNSSVLIEHRKKEVENGIKPPYRFLEIYTNEGEHIVRTWLPLNRAVSERSVGIKDY